MSWDNQSWLNPNQPNPIKLEKEPLPDGWTKGPFKDSWIKYEQPVSLATLIELEILVPVKVQGEAIGDLMVYGWGGEWYVAHIPTETRFDQAVPEGDWTKEQLIVWCAKVQKDKRSIWDKLKEATYETYNDDKYSTFKVSLKIHCLEIEIK